MIQEFTTYLTAIRGYSQNTAKAYARDCKQFAKWAKENIIDARWSTIQRADIDRYIIAMGNQGLKPATTNRHLSSISALYNYLKREGKIEHNPCQYESRRKIAQTIPNTIDIDQLREAYSKSYGIAHEMIGILATTGMRIQELLDMRYEDIDFADSSIKVNGKGNKQRIVYANESTLATLKTHAEIYGKSGIVFAIDQRHARYLIWQALRPYCKGEQLSPHAIRHTFATNMARHGQNAMHIARMLGHNHIETSQKYIDLSQMDTKTACQQYAIIN